jgi:hypothetical protein
LTLRPHSGECGYGYGECGYGYGECGYGYGECGYGYGYGECGYGECGESGRSGIRQNSAKFSRRCLISVRYALRDAHEHVFQIDLFFLEHLQAEVVF